MKTIKYTIKLFFLSAVLAASTGLCPTLGLAQDVCSQGVGLPPFLSSGAEPNLLLLLDNSGSMLDMAYTDAGNQCFDDTYLSADPDKIYAGNYEAGSEGVTLYKWQDATLPSGVTHWARGTCYAAGDLVLDGGMLYKATCLTPSCAIGSSSSNNGCPSAGNNVKEDNENGGVTWSNYFDHAIWQSDNPYTTNDFVKYQSTLYRAKRSANADADATSPIDDTLGGIGPGWDAVEHTWIAGHGYVTGDIATYKGMLFRANQNFTSSTTGLFDDRASSAGTLRWDRIDEGYFEPMAAGDTGCNLAFSYTRYNTDGSVDLAIRLEDSSGNLITDVASQTAANVACFVASGNFLNWATASKFDIEKKILTGGKYHAGYEENNTDGTVNNAVTTDSGDDRIVGEHRGCGNLGFTKQVKLTDGADGTADTADDIMLTLKVRGANDNDWIDTTDHVTRMDILAVTAGGYSSEECQAVVQAIIDGSSFNSISNLITSCLGNAASDERAALNHALQYCEALRSKDTTRDINTMVGDCEAVYAPATGDIHPSTIQAEQGSYACYGVFDKDVLHSDRKGYMGRCWTVPTDPDCWQKACTNACTAPPCYYEIASRDFMCAADGFEYECLGNFNSNHNTCNQDWTAQYIDAANASCTPSGGTVAGWSSDTDGTPGEPDGTFADGACHDGTADEGVDCECLGQALHDYCQDLSVPEVVDPSDLASTTIDYLGLPGTLVDSGVLSQLGVKYPLVTYKGYIKYQPDTGDSTDKPDGPTGLLYEVADTLRLGVMDFVDNGSKTECDNLAATCSVDINGDYDACVTDSAGVDCTYCEARQSIEKFCPQNNNDGSRVLVSVGMGMAGAADGTEDWSHYLDLVAGINNSRATAWTPLAEAMYTAVGYYTQNIDFCLDTDDTDTTKCNSFTISADADPVKYWCQDNHVLVITEGASTADINDKVKTFITTPSAPGFSSNTGKCAGAGAAEDDSGCKGVSDDMSGDNSTDSVVDTACTGGLDGSTYLDDMTWWGRNVLPFYAQRQIETSDETWEDKQNITSHIVTTGALRNTGTDECNPVELMTDAAVNGGRPAGYYSGESPEELEQNLRAVLNDILGRASSGSAATVVSSSRRGGGAIYQAVFWPEREDANNNEVSWVGDVNSLFISSAGDTYEDTNQNGMRDAADNQLVYYFSDKANRTRGCYVTGTAVCPPTEANDPIDNCDGSVCVELEDIKYFWSANNQLMANEPATRKIFTWNDADNDGIVDNDSTNQEWFQLNDMTSAEWNALNATADAQTGVFARGHVTKDFLTSVDQTAFVTADGSDMELDALSSMIDWIAGNDHLVDGAVTGDSLVADTTRTDMALRSRKFLVDGTEKTWRLGDVISSTPTVVARPAEAYHYIYRDPTYKKFAQKWAKRRNVIYFGANDGMLHAVNSGFFYENMNQFCCTAAVDSTTGRCSAPVTKDATTGKGVCITGKYNPGEELWAYIPYNLQPHLKCLADPNYSHKYFIDQKPKIFDVQIFAEEAACRTDVTSANCIHAGGWGTILVGGMRFGGAPILASDLNDDTTDKREFTSSFFILDITNPEADPVLLGELTRTTETETDGSETYVDLNYTTSLPTLVIMRDTLGSNASDPGTNAKSEWYLVMGSGPTGLDGTNTSGEPGKLAVFPLSLLQGGIADTSWARGVPWSIDTAPKAFRIKNSPPVSPEDGTARGSVFEVPGTGPSFISDLSTVDFDVELEAAGDLGSMYRSDAVYFGTTDGSGFSLYDEHDFSGDFYYWNKGGRIFRMVTKVLDGKDEKRSTPSEWAEQWTAATTDADNPLRLLLDAQMPVTASPSVAFDGDSYWIYGGTGRFWGAKDKTDDGWENITPDPNTRSKVSYFGLREPTKYISDETTQTCANSRLEMTWGSIDWDINVDDNDALLHNGTPGNRGLMQVDQILVADGSTSKYGNNISYVECATGTPDDCFPNSLTSETIKNQVTDNDDTGVYTFEALRKYIAGTGCEENSSPVSFDSTGLDGWYREFDAPRERNLSQAALLGGLTIFTTYQPYSDKCKSEGESYLYAVYYQTGTAWSESVFGTDEKTGGETVLDSPNSCAEYTGCSDGPCYPTCPDPCVPCAGGLNSCADYPGCPTGPCYPSCEDNPCAPCLVKERTVKAKLSLGEGLAAGPSIHVGGGGDDDGGGGGGGGDDNTASAEIQTSKGEKKTIKIKPALETVGTGRQNWSDRCE